MLQVGDVLWVTAPGSSALSQDTVVAVEQVEAEGLFNPYTDEGAPFKRASVAGSHGRT